jgi:hypothetical protein
MEIKQKTQTTLTLTAQDVEKIVTEYLDKLGYTVAAVYPQIKTVYDGDYNSEEFAGLQVLANVSETNLEIS